MMEIGPRISKSSAKTANVYGLRSARRTIHIVRQSLLRSASACSQTTMRTRDRKGVGFLLRKKLIPFSSRPAPFDDEELCLNCQTAMPSVSTSRRNGIAAINSEANPNVERVYQTKHSADESLLFFLARSEPVRPDARTLSFYGRRLSGQKSRVPNYHSLHQNGCRRTNL